MYCKMFLKATLLALMLIAVTADEDITSAGFKTVLRVYDECNKSVGGFTPCLKKKAISFIDRLSKIDKFPVGEGLYVVKASEINVKSVTENELESSLPRGLEERDAALSSLLMSRVVAFFNSRTFQINFPKLDTEQLGRSLEEGRGKMKKMMGMMGMGMAMKMAAMVPMAMAALFMLAGKALITAKIALLLSGIIALKKLLSKKESGGHESHGWSSSGGSGGGGWDRRSIAQPQSAAHKLAYNSYLPQ